MDSNWECSVAEYLYVFCGPDSKDSYLQTIDPSVKAREPRRAAKSQKSQNVLQGPVRSHVEREDGGKAGNGRRRISKQNSNSKKLRNLTTRVTG